MSWGSSIVITDGNRGGDQGGQGQPIFQPIGQRKQLLLAALSPLQPVLGLFNYHLFFTCSDALFRLLLACYFLHLSGLKWLRGLTNKGLLTFEARQRGLISSC